jgi:hypothetical protein
MKHFKYARKPVRQTDRRAGSTEMRARETQLSTVRPEALRDETAKHALGSHGMTTATNVTNAEALGTMHANVLPARKV